MWQHDLLDEIHGLRKGNTELESQIDSLRQRLLDRQESTESVTGVPLTSTRIYQVSKIVVNHLNLVFCLGSMYYNSSI